MLLGNSIAHYYDQVQSGLYGLFGNSEPVSGAEFTVGAKLPALTPRMRDYFSVSTMSHTTMPAYKGRSLSLLDLTRDPGTATTKTFPSLVMVARAIGFIQETGERVTIITPSSANKATALRDAVLRAITCKLVKPEQLNVVAMVPVGSVHKLRATQLSTDPELLARNPIAVYYGPRAEAVKTISRAVVDQHRSSLERGTGTNIWYTMQLENYLAGDVVRAFAEAEFFAPADGVPRLHVHAVSSAYGLLGHDYGRRLLGDAAPGLPSRYFLVQHLGAPDMVTSLYSDAANEPMPVPVYTRDARTGRYVQHDNPRFPAETFDPEEVLDTTFYTRQPATSHQMNAVIRAQGGGGIVVSLAECLQRYGEIRALLSEAGLNIPANPTAVLEWSLIMATTGLMTAIDRGVITETDILVHGSGLYRRGDFETLGPRDINRVNDANALRDLVFKASAP